MPLQMRRRGYAQVRLHRAMSAQTVAITPGAIVRLAYSLSPAPAEPSGVPTASHTQRAYARIETRSRVSASPRMIRIGGFSGSTPPSALSTKAPAMSKNATKTAAAWNGAVVSAYPGQSNGFAAPPNGASSTTASNASSRSTSASPHAKCARSDVGPMRATRQNPREPSSGFAGGSVCTAEAGAAAVVSDDVFVAEAAALIFDAAVRAERPLG